MAEASRKAEWEARATTSPDSKIRQSQNRISLVRLASDDLRIPLEAMVSQRLGRRWAVNDARDMTEFACHPCAILSDRSYSVFAKFSDAANGSEQLEIELAGLRLLSERAGILTPPPIGVVPVPGESILVLGAVQARDRSPENWGQIGHTLARLHAIKGRQFGLEVNGYFGPLYQDNTPMSDWPAFFAERRIGPGLRLAVDSGNMPTELVRQVETLISRLPDLCGPAVAPSLLHGDAQQNNFISTEEGVVAIDPAPYFGHPEVHLAALDYWQAVPDDVFEGYQEVLPVDPGFWERRNLWRVWAYLAAVTVEGFGHIRRLTEAVKQYG